MPAVLISMLAVALAQPDAGPGMPAETDATAADVQRSLEADGGAPDAGTPAVAENNAQATPPAAAAAPSLADDIDGKISASLRLSETLVSWFPVDDLGTYV